MEAITLVFGIISAIAAVFEIISFFKTKKQGNSERVSANKSVQPTLNSLRSTLNYFPQRTYFVGREHEMELLWKSFRSHLPITIVKGIGGIGKTSLVLEFAHEIIELNKNKDCPFYARFDNVIWIPSKDKKKTLNNIHDIILKTVGYTPLIKLNFQEKHQAIIDLFQKKTVLLIFDNFEFDENKEIVDFIKELHEPNKCIVTTRYSLPIEGWTIKLAGLSKDNCLQLMQWENHGESTKFTHKTNTQLMELYRQTKGHPLVIKWAVGLLKNGQSIEMVLKTIREGSGTVFDRIFSASWSFLSSNAKKLLCVITVFEVPASFTDLIAGTGFKEKALANAITELLKLNLISSNDEINTDRKRFNLHPLVNSYAKKQACRWPRFYNDVYERLSHWYTLFTSRNGGVWNYAGYSQIELELPNIISVLKWSWKNSLIKNGSSIFENISHFLVIRGYWDEALELANQAIRHSREIGDLATCARFHSWPISWIFYHRDELDKAEWHDTKAIEILKNTGYSSISYQKMLFYTKRNLGRIASKKGDYKLAKEFLFASLNFYRSINDNIMYPSTSGDIAQIFLLEGNLDSALEMCKEALPISEKVNDPERAASLFNIMAEISLKKHQDELSKIFLEKAFKNYKRAERIDSVSECLIKIALIDIRLGNYKSAKSKLSVAVNNFQEIGVDTRADYAKEILNGLPPQSQ